MRATDALPPKAARHTCSDCGLQAPAPIVVKIDDRYARCANRNACNGRIRRTNNKRKEQSNA